MKRAAWVLALGLISGAAIAAAAEEFAWRSPLTVDGQDGVYRVVFDEALYRHATRADLTDIIAVNAAGEEIPFGPVPLPEARPAPPPKPVVALPWYVVPREGAPSATGESLALHIERDVDGRVRKLDSTITPGTLAVGADILLDLSRIDVAVTALDVHLHDSAGANFHARVDVLGSSDLRGFDLVSLRQTLLRLDQNGYRLERLRLELPATRRAFLLLRPIDATSTLPISGVDAVLRPVDNDTREVARREIVATPQVDKTLVPGEFHYTSGGPFPIERLALSLADANAIAQVSIESRDRDDGPWQRRASFTAFRSTAMGEEVSSLPIDIGATRDRFWRVLAEPALARAPTLTLSYRADQFVVMTQGAAPYAVLAGSARRLRQDYPLTSMLAALNARLGANWRPTAATVGEGQALAGETALKAPPKPLPMRQIVLWGVLVLGAIFVFYMIARLLKESGVDPAPKP